jgi:hypothetical protein
MGQIVINNVNRFAQLRVQIYGRFLKYQRLCFKYFNNYPQSYLLLEISGLHCSLARLTEILPFRQGLGLEDVCCPQVVDLRL